MNISLAPEIVLHLGQLAVTNSMLAGWAVSILLILFAFWFRRQLGRLPGRLQTAFELVYGSLYDTALSIIGDEAVVRTLFPYLITLFLYIIFSSWIGLVPGISSFGLKETVDGKDVIIPLLRAPDTDLNAVAALACVSVFYVQFLGIRQVGLKGYLGKFFNFKSPIDLMVGLLELLSEFTRLISFTFRLFGNIFAGEVLLAVIVYLTITLLPAVVPLPLPFFILETLVAVVQAYVFYFLTVIFVALAVTSHAEHEPEQRMTYQQPVNAS